ncbi:MAG: DUF1648 domain-containing protein [Firmicutes bacterium]|nr:DUF1648 domain-containing protein [Bacillota bacterium]
MYLAVFVINVCVSVLCGAFMAVLPSRTRKAFLFGVRVPEAIQERGDCVRLRRTYVASVLICAAAVIALEVIQYFIRPEWTVVCALYYPLLLAAAQLYVYVRRWKEAKRLKAENGWIPAGVPEGKAEGGVGPRGSLRDVPWGYYIASALVILVCAIAALALYPSLPERIATHFDINMVPDAWSGKSVGVVLMMPMFMAGTLVLMILVGAALAYSRMQVSASDMARSRAQIRAFRSGMGHCVGICALGLVAGMALLMLPTLNPDIRPPFWLTMLVLLGPAIPLVVFPLRAGQSGGRLRSRDVERFLGPKPAETGKAAGAADGSGTAAAAGDDAKWILGMFYYNPDDPAFVVADRFGVNIGFNYARAVAKVLVIAAGAAFVVFYVWITVVLARL